MVMFIREEVKLHFAHVNGKGLQFLCQQLRLLKQEGHLTSPDMAKRLANDVSS